MIKVKNLTYAYSRKKWPVLRDVSLEIQPGKVYGLLGKNGVGKSTLLYLMAGLLTPMNGVVTMDGNDVRRRLPSTLADIFLIPDEVVLPAMKLEEFVKLNAPFYPRFSEEDMARNMEIFDMERDVNLGELSMGQKKKVYMSFALACNTSILLMDEPTNGLDIPGKEAFRRFVAGSMNDDRAIVISTHQVRDLEQLLDHIVILDDAKVILDRSIPEIAEKLKFTLTDSPEVIKSALLAVPAVGGVKVVIQNEDGEETEPDVEMLFNLVVSNQGIVQYIFRKQ
ncbi:MAG: ABC transporter ATP-binding protein [Paenibacillus sp.]|nr:ABC transporter ATP-binding protein [Paenibacillus sp.]